MKQKRNGGGVREDWRRKGEVNPKLLSWQMRDGVYKMARWRAGGLSNGR